MVIRRNKQSKHTKKILDQIIKVDLDKALLDAFPHELSGGKGREFIARSLLLNPSIIVLDEPTSV